MKQKTTLSPKNQFYTMLNEIKKLHDSGLVVARTIYDELFSTGKITMSYMQFTVYFNREIKIKNKEHQTVKTSIKEITAPAVAEVTPEEDNDGPLIFNVGGKGDKKRFNPHAHGIDPSRIL